MSKIRVITVLIITAAFAISSSAADKGLGIKSAIVPGMGQLSAGEGNIMSKNTLKGLGFMAGFVLCLNGVVSEAGAMDSYAQQTRRLDEAVKKSLIFDEKYELKQKHEVAYENYQDAKLTLIVFTGLTALVYGYNIVDAMLFTVKDEAAVSQNEKPVSLGLSYSAGVPSLKLNCRF
ncbi:MAG: hypothetical protein JNL74_21760 [Fibrobacteres bacterium]|nr:hypothetical protein [Fibrobacterota bacterium]